MRIEAAVPVRLVARVAKGEEVDVVLERPARRVKGVVTEIVAEIDPRSRTQMVRLRLEGPGTGVLPGTFGRVWLTAREHDAILVPSGAVTRAGQLEIVQVVQDDRVLKRLVRTGPTYGERVEILSGLDDGDRILPRPLRHAQP
jgi:multidrug efflux pump subunit AcrA (membrane-fusion protein)